MSTGKAAPFLLKRKALSPVLPVSHPRLTFLPHSELAAIQLKLVHLLYLWGFYAWLVAASYAFPAQTEDGPSATGSPLATSSTPKVCLSNS